MSGVLRDRRWARLATAALFAFAWAIAGAPAAAAELLGQVVGISDGDTLRLLVGRREVVIRLSGIDAPEKRQAFGERSRQSLAELAFSKQARAKEHGKDRYGRVLATVYVADQDINAEQVRRGMAWVYRKYTNDATLLALEQDAREARQGLWADAQPIPPWEWRRERKND